MYYVDPILAEARERKAQVSEMYRNIKDLPAYFAAEEARLKQEGWHFVDTEAYFERIKGSRSILQDSKDRVAAFIAQEDAQRAAMA
jgi:hypothetical protein